MVRAQGEERGRKVLAAGSVRARGIAAFRLDGDHECPSDGVRTEFGRSLRNGWCQPSTPEVVIHARASKLRSRLRAFKHAARYSIGILTASCRAHCFASS